MWLTDDLLVNATLEMRAEEARRARLVSEARTYAEQGGQRRPDRAGLAGCPRQPHPRSARSADSGGRPLSV